VGSELITHRGATLGFGSSRDDTTDEVATLRDRIMPRLREEFRLSSLLLAGTLTPGTHVRVDVRDGELDVELRGRAGAAPAAARD
jgi:hypothetical protein